MGCTVGWVGSFSDGCWAVRWGIRDGGEVAGGGMSPFVSGGSYKYWLGYP